MIKGVVWQKRRILIVLRRLVSISSDLMVCLKNGSVVGIVGMSMIQARSSMKSVIITLNVSFCREIVLHVVNKRRYFVSYEILKYLGDSISVLAVFLAAASGFLFYIEGCRVTRGFVWLVVGTLVSIALVIFLP